MNESVTQPHLRDVAVFNPILAHYRAALVRHLGQSKQFRFHFFADSVDHLYGIPALDLDKSIFTRSRCARLFGRFFWQQRAVITGLIGRYDCFVFSGDAAWLSTWIAALIVRLRGRKVLFWTHGWTRIDTGLLGLIRFTFYRLANGLLLYGTAAKRIGTELGIQPSKLHVIFNSVDFDAQQSFQQRLSFASIVDIRHTLFADPAVPVVIATARLTSAKRFDLLIDALAILQQQSKIHLLVVGDGPERLPLESYARTRQVKVAFVGTCYDENMLALYFSCANVTVSPGNVGLTCMHSLGYGVPVITHDDPAQQMPEWEAIEPGETGDLFAFGSADSLARTIRKWTGTSYRSDAVTARCKAAITGRYHPAAQAAAFERAIYSELGGSIQFVTN